MLRRWRWLNLGRAQRGWSCQISGRVRTHRQFSWEEYTAQRGESRFVWLAIVLAFWKWRRETRTLSGIPGPFNRVKVYSRCGNEK